MRAIEHPSHWIDKSVVEEIIRHAPEAESVRDLHSDQLKLIHQQQWLKMFVPKSLGGLELSLPEVLQIEENLAWTDGSTAWVVTLCAGAAWFVGFLEQSLAAEVFSEDHIFFAGSGAITGTAEIIPEGYLLNGNWKYASGSLHATVFTANCLIQKDGKPQLQSDGKPLVRAFLMKKNEVTVHKTWNSIGMVATGSHSFEVKNLKVANNRCFEIDSKKVVIDLPVYFYPFLQLAETTLAVNLSGLAVRFLDLVEETTAEKTNGTLRPIKIAHQSKVKLDEYRKVFYQAVNSSWKSCHRKKAIPKMELEQVSKASQALAKHALTIVDHVYPLCGLRAANSSQEINRVWRNIHTASQHSLFKW